MTKFCSLFILFFTITQGFSQKRTTFNAKDLKVTWETVENNYKGTSETLSKLTLTNIGKDAFPATGWILYFSAGNPRNLNLSQSVFKIEHINGDFFKATPGKSFKGLSPGKSETVQLLSRNLIKRTDFPAGFYITLSSNPDDGIALPFEAITAVDYKDQQRALAEKTFRNNEAIEDIPAALLPPIFPSPLSVKKTKDNFTINKQTKIISDPFFDNEAAYLSSEIEKVCDFTPLTGTIEKQNIIILQKLALPSKEAYKLQVTSTAIIIGAAGSEGIFYGIQSLKNLFPPATWSVKQESISIPGMQVNDAPRFPHRAVMMDIARNFQPK